MLKIKISSDTTCDLSPELRARYDVDTVPLYIVKDGKEYKDTIEIGPEDIYAYARETGKNCSTAAVSVADYEELFRKELETADAIIHTHISSDMSACYQNACIAAREFENVFPIDTRSLSTGIGYLVVEAALLAESGVPAAEIAERINAMRDKLDVTFVIDTLTYLHRGGRCSAVAALGANLLSLKPCIEVRGGKMGVGKKYRGKVEKCIMQYVREKLEGQTDIDTRRLFITHSGGFEPGFLDEVKAEAGKYQHFDEVLTTVAGSTISSHCGPKTLGIIFARK